MPDNNLQAFLEAALNGDIETVQEYLNAGFDVNSINATGMTALHIAAFAGQAAVAKLLLAQDKIEIEGNGIHSPLSLAIATKHTDVAAQLIAKGADVNRIDAQGYSLLQLAANAGQTDIVALLLAQEKIKLRTAYGNPPLLLAIIGGHADVAALLIAKGADVNEVDNEGFTPLQMATELELTDVIELLINKGANIKAENLFGFTAIDLAAQLGMNNIVERLKYALKDDATSEFEKGAGFKTVKTNDWHHHIVSLLIKTGLSFEKKGVCYGGSTAALAAFLRGEDAMRVFIESINASVDMTPERIEAFERLLKEEKNIDISKHPDFRPYMDTVALLQNLIVCQEASLYPHLLPKDTKLETQQTEIEATKIFQPDSKGQIDQMKNTLALVSQGEAKVYTREQLLPFVTDFIAQCEKANEPMGLILEGKMGDSGDVFRGDTHAISCSYDPIGKKWLLFDMNDQPIYRELSVKAVSQFIWKGLVTRLCPLTEEPSPYLTMRARVISTEFQAAKEKIGNHLIERLEQFKMMGIIPSTKTNLPLYTAKNQHNDGVLKQTDSSHRPGQPKGSTGATI